MTSSNLSKGAEIDRNLTKFLEILPVLARDHLGQWVLMRHEAVVGFYQSAMDAQIAGNTAFGDQIFSIQPVKEEAEDLGFFSYAVNQRGS
jgi:hypothetical protein